MIIVMKPDSSAEKLDAVVARIKSFNLQAHLIEGDNQTIVGVVGLPLPPTLDELFGQLPGVQTVLRVSKKYKLAGWDFHPHKSVIDLGDGVTIGGDAISLMAGPCSVESEEQTMSTARAVAASGATILRGGAFKPRTSPYEFRGLGEQGLQILAQAREETGLKIITEVMTPPMSSSSPATPISSRSALATARTTSCWRKSARP